MRLRRRDAIYAGRETDRFSERFSAKSAAN